MKPLGAVDGRQMMNEIDALQDITTPLKILIVQHVALDDRKVWMVLHVRQILG